MPPVSLEPSPGAPHPRAPRSRSALHWVLKTLIGIAVVFVGLVAVFILSLVVNALLLSLLLLSALVGGIILAVKRHILLGLSLVTVAIMSAVFGGSEIAKMWRTDRTLNGFADKICSQPLPKDVTTESCEGKLAHTSNGNWCDYQVQMVVSSSTSADELEDAVYSLRIPHVSGAGAPGEDRFFEVLSSEGDETRALFTAVPGFIDDWRCQ